MWISLELLAWSILFSVPIITVWALGIRDWLFPAIALSALSALLMGRSIFHLVELATVATLGVMAYFALSSPKDDGEELR
jgi:hypothetical protein